MKILAIEKETAGIKSKDFEPYLKSEAERVWQLYNDGFIREIYFTKDTHEAVIILECKNTKEAKNILKSLPLVKNKLINFDIKPLTAYDGFNRLFNK